MADPGLSAGYRRARRMIPPACIPLFAASLFGGGAYAATSANAIAGATFAGEPARIGMVEARAMVGSHWALAASVVYFEGASDYEEMQLRIAATGSVGIGGWTIENRHMLSFSTESVERYRSRVRLLRPIFGTPAFTARAFDELFVDTDRARLFRNNVALGFGWQPNSRLTAELYHVWVGERGARDDAYILALVTLRLGPPRR